MCYVKLRLLLSHIWDAVGGEEGQTLFEVTLIISLVALVALVVLSALGVAAAGLFNPLPAGFGG